MESRLIPLLSSLKRLAPRSITGIAILVPAMFCLAASPTVSAQVSQPTIPSPEVTAERAAEQALPRTAVPFDPTRFDRYVGYYQLGPTAIMTITRHDGHFLGQLTGQVAVEWFPESDTKFFASVVHAQISFNVDTSGRVTNLVLHQGGLEQTAPRIDEATAKQVESALTQRIKDNTPSPGTEAALRQQIETMEKGERDFSALMPGLAAAAQAQWPVMKQNINSLGALSSITFQGVSPQGWDIYNVAFERGAVMWQITPLTPDGKISGMFWRRLP